MNGKAPSGDALPDALFQQFFEETPAYLSVHDRDYRLIRGNRRFRKVFGNRIGERCYRVFRGLDAVCPDCPQNREPGDGGPMGTEQMVFTRQGNPLAVMVHSTPIRNGSGEIVAVLETHTDIQEVHNLKRRLQRRKARYERLFEEVPSFVAVLGPDLRIQEINRNYRRTFGGAIGDHCYEAYKRRDEACPSCPAFQTFSDGEVHQHEELATTARGEEMSVLCTLAPIYDVDGEVHAVIQMINDISPLRQAQSQLESIGLLVGTISHSIKGLLTGLDGGVYLVKTGLQKNDHTRLTRGWDMVTRNIDNIRSMILDILYISKDRPLERVSVDVVSLAQELHEIARPKATSCSVELSFDVPADSGTFFGDIKLVRVMLVNLLENALDACRTDRAKEAHHVRMTIRRAPPWMTMEIEDDGVGMDRESASRVFSLFFSSKGKEGTGLGLYVSNKIARQHGGAIELSSELDRGTRVRVRLPVEEPGLLEGTTP